MMSFIWTMITGFVLTLILKSSWGFVIGLFVGPALYRAFSNKITEQRTQANPVLYLAVFFEVLGHLSKAKGVVTQNDINLARHFMDQMQLDSKGKGLAQESFNTGKASDYPIKERLAELYSQYRFSRHVLNIFCEQLIQAAIIDGTLHSKEEQILFTIADAFNVPRQKMAVYIQMMMGSFHFHQQSQQQHQQGYRHSNYDNNNYGNNSYGGYQPRSSKADLQHAYQVLGVDANQDATSIKRAYRKLMNEHHPDKLVSKGLPKEMLESAKKRAQEIQAAYDLIKAARGFK